jgi:WD40 repeat protein
MSSVGLVGALCASALAPVLAVAAGAGAVVIAGVGVLGSVGANVLTDVVTKAIEGLRVGGRRTTHSEVEAAVAAAIERALVAGPLARSLRRDVAAVLRETGTVAAALEAAVEVGDPATKDELTAALTAVSAEFEEFGFVLAEIQEAAGAILEMLRRQDAERRADRGRAYEIAVQLWLLREELAVVERRTRLHAMLAAGGGQAVAWAGCPYRGLLPFEQDHTAVFFGRERLTAELVTALATRLTGLGMLVVTGASGAGKSSLLRAGLLPALARGSLVDGSAEWPRIVLTPTRTPLEELATHLAVLGGMGATTVRRDLAGAPDRAHMIVRQALLAAAGSAADAPDGPAARVVIVVDQFEELLTLGSEDQRAAFVTALHAAAATPAGPRGEPPALVVLGLRGDFWDLCAGYPQLVEALRAGPFVVGPMTEPELHRAITGPAAAAGLELEPGLVEAVLGELRGAGTPSVGALPLLSQAMLVTWEHRSDGGLLTHRGYGLSGGIAHAVQASAEAAYSDLTDRQQDEAKTMFRRMTVLSRDGQLARRRLARADLYAAGARGDVDTVLDVFVARRLISLNEGGVEIAHDALLGAWPRLRGWLDGDIADLALYNQLIDDAAGWVEKGRDGSFLYRGGQLTVVSEAAARWRGAPNQFPPLASAATEFLAAGRRQHRRRVTAWRGVLAVIVVLLVVAGTAAVVLRQRTDELGRQLRAGAAQLLVARSRELNRSDPIAAILMAVAAYRSSPDPAVLTNLADEYLRYRSTSRLLAADVGQISDVHVSADGSVVAALGAQGRIALWRLDQQPVVPTYLGRGLTHSALSPDGNLIAGSGGAGRVEVWRVDGTSVFQQEAGTGLGYPSGLRFDPAGRRLLAIPSRGGPKVWDIARRQAVQVPPGLVSQFDQPVDGVWFGPRGESVVVATDAALTLWHLSTGDSTLVSALDVGDTASISGDGLTAITCADAVHLRWDLDRVRERDQHPIPGESCRALEADATGTIAITSEESEVALRGPGIDYPRTVFSVRDLRTGHVARPILPTGVRPEVERLATLPDGARLIASVGAAVAVVDIPTADFTPLNTAMSGHFEAKVSQDGTQAILPARIGEPWLTLWDVGSGRELARSTEIGDRPLGFLGDGTLLGLDGKWEHLVVREVPSLKVTSRLPLPVGPGVTRATPLSRLSFGGLCAADESVADTIPVFFGGLITRFNIRSGTQVGEPMRPWRTRQELDQRAGGYMCAIRPDTDAVAIDVDQQTIEMWDLVRSTRVRTLDPAGLGTLADIDFSPDGRLLAMLDIEGQLQIWDVDENAPIAAPQRVSEPSLELRILGFPAPDRIMVETAPVFGGQTKTVVWDPDRRAAIADLDFNSGTSVLSPDGRTLHRFGNHRSSHIPLDPLAWVDGLCRVGGRDMTDAERQALPPGSVTDSLCRS